MPKLDFIYFDAGGGHRAAANALKQACAERYPGWEVRLMNLQHELDSLDIFRQITGIRMEDVYNLVLRKGWTLGSPQLLVAMHLLIRMYHPLQVKKLKEYWSKDAPDLAVSLIPNFNRAIHEALGAVSPKTKMVSVLTDLADYPPNFWIERGQKQYFVCGTEKAERQALELGHVREMVQVHRRDSFRLWPSMISSRALAAWQAGCVLFRTPMSSESSRLRSPASNSPARICRAMCSHGTQSGGRWAFLASASKSSSAVFSLRMACNSSGGQSRAGRMAMRPASMVSCRPSDRARFRMAMGDSDMKHLLECGFDALAVLVHPRQIAGRFRERCPVRPAAGGRLRGLLLNGAP